MRCKYAITRVCSRLGTRPPCLTCPGKLAERTAQRTQRQGVTAARNVPASLANRQTRAYRHKNLGLAVDLTSRNAIVTPFGVRLRGLLAKLAGGAYHLMALPSEHLRPLSDLGALGQAVAGGQDV